MSDNKQQHIGKCTFDLEDGRIIEFIAIEDLTWVSKEKRVELDEKEYKKAVALRYNIDKVLTVKGWLESGATPTEIQRNTGISRNTIYKYLKILSGKYTKSSGKACKKAGKYTFVLFNPLLVSELCNESTLSWLLLLLPLLLLLGEGLKWAKKRYQKDYLAHKAECKELHELFRQAMGYSLLQTPILCSSEKQKAYYNDLLKVYKNRNRKVELIERLGHEDNHAYYEKKTAFSLAYFAANKEKIERGKEEYQSAMKKLRTDGWLDYFDYTKKDTENWERSRTYLYGFVAYLKQHARPNINSNSTKKPVYQLAKKTAKIFNQDANNPNVVHW